MAQAGNETNRAAARFIGTIKTKRNTLIAAAVLLLAAAAWLFAQRGGAGAQYQSAAVARGALTQAVTATGTLNPVVNVQVGSQVSGNIQKLFADFNSEVKAGQVIAQIDPAIFQANVTQAEGELANARAALDLARLNANRTQSLVAKQNSAQSELDQVLAALRQAEAAVKIKEGALERAKVDLERCTITSPIDGIIISRTVDVGQTVAASLSAPVLFTIAQDLSRMQINANVAEADIGAVAAGQDVDFTVDAFPFRTFKGKVEQVRNAPITVQNVVTYDTVIGVTNPEMKLKPGMTANVSIVIAQREGVLKLSNAALRFRPAGAARVARGRAAEAGNAPREGGGRGSRDQRTVFILKGSEPRAVEIKTGISDGVSTEVLEGLNEGDQVVTAAVAPASRASSSPAANPFGGQRGGRRF